MSKQTRKPTPGMHAGTARFHTYNVGVAIDLNDTIAAIVFHHIYINIERLEENGKVDSDGVAWLTVSKIGIIRFLCEFTKSQIETAIGKLVDNQLLVKKVSNRKNSYTLSEVGWSYYPRLEEEGPIKAPKAEVKVKADAEEAKSAEKENHSTKSIDKKAFVVSDTAKEVIDYVNQKTGKHFDYAPSYCKNIDYLVKVRGYTKDQMIAVVDHRFEELFGTRDFNTGMNPSKLFYIKTFEKFLEDAKIEITLSPEQLVQDAKEKREYHLREAKKMQIERLVLETGACDDNLPFDLITATTPEAMAKDRRKKELYHLREADKFADMAKFLSKSKIHKSVK